MKYVPEPAGYYGQHGCQLRKTEIKYMHWQAKQIAKSVAAYKAAPKQHDEHCYTRRHFLFMRELMCEGYFWRERGLPSPPVVRHDNIRYPMKRKTARR
jgi:hypothetical protein